MTLITIERFFYILLLTAHIIINIIKALSSTGDYDGAGSGLVLTILILILVTLVISTIYLFKNKLIMTIVVSAIMFLYSIPLLYLSYRYILYLVTEYGDPARGGHEPPHAWLIIISVVGLVYVWGSIRLVVLRRKALRLIGSPKPALDSQTS